MCCMSIYDTLGLYQLGSLKLGPYLILLRSYLKIVPVSKFDSKTFII